MVFIRLLKTDVGQFEKKFRIYFASVVYDVLLKVWCLLFRNVTHGKLNPKEIETKQNTKSDPK